MRFMVIETFRNTAAVYARLAERGRMIPAGVSYVDSSVEEGGGRCFQLMECERRADLDPWIEAWADLVDFEVVPVTDSATAAARFKG
ncbi:DUF3303 family protein [Pelagibius sp. CAU 1746]|uniref:DUF3303 domain-containing protein n=1 Tax=Pelagibius sp. CAU 1746 TaxID=3140370 RepID=UPI00325A5268